jgi:hypothetical protein
MEPSLQTVTSAAAAQEPSGAVGLSRAGLPMDPANRSSHPLCRRCA